MYQAPVIATLIGISAIWNEVGCRLEKAGYRIPLYFHHYGFMYASLSYYFCIAGRSMYLDVMTPSNWLDKDTTHKFVVHGMHRDGDYDEDDGYALWKNESTFEGLEGLKTFSMLCPLWVTLTLLVCIWHTHQHINKIRYIEEPLLDEQGEIVKDESGKPKHSGKFRPNPDGRLVDFPQHNQTMTVLILPCVYGLLSFKSSIRMWLVMINFIPGGFGNHNSTADAYGSYTERKEFLLEMYEANFMVGDIYETYALVTFGHLVMGVLKKRIDKMKGIFSSDVQDRPDAEKSEMEQNIERLVDAMKTLTVAGVKLFALSCLLQGLYTLIITTFAFDFPGVGDAYFSRLPLNNGTEPGLFQQEATKTMTHYFFLGAGFIASFAAIGNIMIIEEDFEDFLHEFQPSLKFWGTKILVSLAFLQSILISLFVTPRGWSEIQSNLLYSSALCLECLLIAIFHVKGWGADEEWYGDYDPIIKSSDGKLQRLPSSKGNKFPGEKGRPLLSAPSAVHNVPDENK